MIDGAESAIMIQVYKAVAIELNRRQVEGRRHRPVEQAYTGVLAAVETLQQRLQDEEALKTMQRTGQLA